MYRRKSALRKAYLLRVFCFLKFFVEWITSIIIMMIIIITIIIIKQLFRLQDVESPSFRRGGKHVSFNGISLTRFPKHKASRIDLFFATGTQVHWNISLTLSRQLVGIKRVGLFAYPCAIDNVYFMIHLTNTSQCHHPHYR